MTLKDAGAQSTLVVCPSLSVFKSSYLGKHLTMFFENHYGTFYAYRMIIFSSAPQRTCKCSQTEIYVHRKDLLYIQCSHYIYHTIYLDHTLYIYVPEKLKKITTPNSFIILCSVDSEVGREGAYFSVTFSTIYMKIKYLKLQHFFLKIKN